MNASTPSERVSTTAPETRGLTAVIDSVAKLNALLGGNANGADRDCVGPNDAGDADARRKIVERMAIRIGDLGLLFPVNAGREVVGPPPVTRIPNSATWLRGLANVRGSLVPVIDAAAALGVVHTAGTPPYLLIFGQGENAIGLTIDGLPRLLEIDPATLVRDPPKAPPQLAPGVSATYEHAGRIWFDVDLDVWFDALAREVARSEGASATSESLSSTAIVSRGADSRSAR
jgi:chemotaxis signal transduction protein